MIIEQISKLLRAKHKAMFAGVPIERKGMDTVFKPMRL